MLGRLRYIRTIGAGELTRDRITDAVQRRLTDVPHRMSWQFSSRAKESRLRMRAFADRHEGQTCVILANGPSLARTDFSLLDGVTTIGMNRAYRLKEQYGVEPTYLVCMDLESQLYQISGELAKLSYPVFVNWNARSRMPATDNVYFIKQTFRPRFSTEAAKSVWGGHSVTYVCLQLAYYMGFSTVILVGKDHRYATSEPPGRIIRATGAEGNHFVSGYYKPGAIFRAPDYKGEELAYEMAREAFEKDGRRVIDATDGGALQVFLKKSLRTALKNSRL